MNATTIDTYAEAGMVPTDTYCDDLGDWFERRWEAAMHIGTDKGRDLYALASEDDGQLRLDVLNDRGVIYSEAKFGADDFGQRMFIAAAHALFAAAVQA